MDRLRKTGLVIPEVVPSGTHLCQFYETRDDLLEVLVPFFREGLLGHEACLWITDEPISADDARRALETALPDVDKYLASGQLQIRTHRDWYLHNGRFDIEAVLAGWAAKVAAALAAGYTGVRATAAADKLQNANWSDLMAYEEQVQAVLGQVPIVALCSYPLDQCSAARFLEVVNLHDCALVRRLGRWECVDSQGSQKLFRQLFTKQRALDSSTTPLVMTDVEGRLTYVNRAALDAWGYARDDEVLGHPAAEFWADGEQLADYRNSLRANGQCRRELQACRRDGSNFTAEAFGSMIRDEAGKTLGAVIWCIDVTQRRLAETRLRQSEQRYRTLVENVNLGISLIDHDYRIVTVNSALAELSGCTADDCRGRECFKVFERRDARCQSCPGAVAMATGRPAEIERDTSWPDGTPRHVRLQAFPVYDSDGQPEGFIEVVEDITDRKREQDTLRRATFSIEQAGDSVFWIGPAGQIVFANQMACDTLEYTREELQSMTVFDINPHITPEWWSTHWQELRARKSFVIETMHHTKSGRDVPVEISINYLQCEGVEYNCAFARDISDRKQAEARIRASEEKYRTYINNSSMGVFVADARGHYIEVNDAACQLLGYSMAELLSRSVDTIVVPEDIGRALGEYQRLMSTGEPVSAEYGFFRKDGRRIAMTVDAVRLEGNRAIGFCIDVTKRREAEKQLRESSATLQATNRQLAEARDKAEAANRAKTEFLANMSHELRTPLTAILGFSDLLLDGATGGEAAEACRVIKRNGEHLLKLINDILDLSRIEVGQQRVELQPCSPQQIVEEVVTMLWATALSKGVAISMATRGDVPDRVRSDPSRLRQILVNLIGNAVKFTERGEIRITLSPAESEPSDGRLLVEVADTGIGIAPENLPLLFRPFSQVDAAANRRYGGTGLGLAISRRLARMLGGDIQVSSETGRGTTFRFEFDAPRCFDEPTTDSPALPAAPPSIAQARPVAPVASESMAANEARHRVLLAEDGPDNQRLIVCLLRRAGVEVCLAENGAKAVEQVFRQDGSTCEFDLILMDMQMPVLDGYEATRRLRTRGYRGPIVALTAHAMREDRQKCLDAGCDDYLTKPIARDTLLGLLTRYTVDAVGGR